MEEKKVKIGEKYKCIASPRYTCFKIGDTYEIKDEFEAELISLCRDCFTLDEESEDERIRKELIEFIKEGKGYCCPSSEKRQKWAHWLEKQKPANKVEPKFKVGDWVVKQYLSYPFVIVDIKNDSYILNDIEGNKYEETIDFANRVFHLWTIKDANDGDVLAAHECLVLFREIDGLNIRCYCTYHFMNNPSFYVDTLQNKDAFHPATQEQRDLLFQKMKEYGYEWNADKKELKKIEQPSTDWSEEDEKMKSLIISTLTSMGTLNLERYHHMNLDEVKNWLKSLKPQPNQYDKGYNDGYSAAKYNQWKPTDKQMEDFRMLLDYNIGMFDYTKFMSVDSLYEDLKKNLID